jgi:hypothetical protein
MKSLSRRSALHSVALLPLVLTSKTAQISASDAALVQLGRQFDAVAARIDHGDTARETINYFSRIYDEIVATPATTMEGLFIKARVECWGLLGDLDAGQPNSNMALSIIRDLIRLHEPSLEQPGAVQRLVEEIEQNAGPPKPA